MGMVNKWKGPVAIIMGILFIIGGANHFLMPEWYAQLLPEGLQSHLWLIYFSGALLILLGAGVMTKKFRKVAAWGLVILLFLMFPANLYLAQTQGLVLGIPAWNAWLRLPLQIFLIILAYSYTRGTSNDQT